MKKPRRSNALKQFAFVLSVKDTLHTGLGDMPALKSKTEESLTWLHLQMLWNWWEVESYLLGCFHMLHCCCVRFWKRYFCLESSMFNLVCKFGSHNHWFLLDNLSHDGRNELHCWGQWIQTWMLKLRQYGGQQMSSKIYGAGRVFKGVTKIKILIWVRSIHYVSSVFWKPLHSAVKTGNNCRALISHNAHFVRYYP